MTAPRPDLAGRTRAPQFLTVAEVAAHLRVSKMTIYRLCHEKALASVRIGRSMRIPAEAVADYEVREATV